MLVPDFIFFQNKLFLNIKNERLNNLIGSYSIHKGKILLVSFLNLIISCIILTLYLTVKNEEIDKTSLNQAALFNVYLISAFSFVIFIVCLFMFKLSKSDSNFITYFLSVIIQIIICFEVFLINYYISSDTKEDRNIYSKFFIELTLKLLYLIFTENYYLNFLIANLSFILIQYFAEAFVSFHRGFENVTFEALNILLFCFLLYMFNLRSYSKLCLDDQLQNIYLKKIGKININTKKNILIVDSILSQYLKEHEVTQLFDRSLNDITIFSHNQAFSEKDKKFKFSIIGQNNNHINNRINNLAESGLTIIKQEELSFDKKVIIWIFSKITLDFTFDSEMRLLLNDINQENDNIDKLSKIDNFINLLYSSHYTKDKFYGILGQFYIDFEIPSKTRPSSEDGSSKDKSINETPNNLKIIVNFEINKENKDVQFTIYENPSYSIVKYREMKKVSENFLFLSKITHEFKSPLLSIDILLDKLDNDLYNYHREVNKINNKKDEINGNLICNSDFNRFHSHKLVGDIYLHDIISSEPILKYLNKSYATIQLEIRKVRDLSHFVIILFKDIEYLTKNTSNNNKECKQSLVYFKSSSDLKDIFQFSYNILDTKNLLSSKKIKINKFYDNTLPKNIFTDEIRLKQVLVNLLTNAIKFTNKGEISLSFLNIVDAKERKKYVKFIVKDTGKGMSQDKRESILSNKNFMELNKDQTIDNKYGTGLGLSIVKDIINNVGEDFDIHTKENEGTTISFKIKYYDQNWESRIKEIEENKSIRSSEDEDSHKDDHRNQDSSNDSENDRELSFSEKQNGSIVKIEKINELNSNYSKSFNDNSFKKLVTNQIVLNNSQSQPKVIQTSNDFTVQSRQSNDSIQTKKIAYNANTDYNFNYIENNEAPFIENNFEEKKLSKINSKDLSNNYNKIDNDYSPMIIPKKRNSMSSLDTKKTNDKKNNSSKFISEYEEVVKINNSKKPRKSKSSNLITKSLYFKNELTKVIEESESEMIIQKEDIDPIYKEKVDLQSLKDNNKQSNTTEVKKKKLNICSSVNLQNFKHINSFQLPYCKNIIKEQTEFESEFSILVVDDQSTFRNSYKHNIINFAQSKNIKVQVDTAENGMQALNLAFKNIKSPYIAIILDQNMDNMKGNEIAFVLRGSEEYKQSKIFLATAESEVSHLLKVNKIKVIDDVLSKTHLKNDVQKVFSVLGFS